MGLPLASLSPTTRPPPAHRPPPLPPSQISEALGLGTIKSRQWSIQETSATKGRGLFEGFDWLVTCIQGGGAAAS